MWNCPACKESIEEELEVCWNCGTAKDGTPDPDFQRENDDIRTSSDEEIQAARDLESALAARWICEKCKADAPTVRYVNSTGAGLSRLMNYQYIKFMAISCHRCGYTEHYDLQVLRSGGFSPMDLLDLL